MSDKRPSDYIKEAFQTGDYLGWFEKVYADAANANGAVPWAIKDANPLLTAWVERQRTDITAGAAAIVIGCGLGDDAEYLAAQGYRVTAFDISQSAIDACKRRFSQSSVDYQVADLFKLPDAWAASFNFVFESRTVQSLPWHMAAPAIEAIARLVAPGGSLLVVCHGREPSESKQGIPWPLSREELAHFTAQGLTEKRFEEFEGNPAKRHFRVTYRKA